MRHRQPRGRYTGRRRAPEPPTSRYAAVVTTAVVGAGVVALGTGAALPGHASSTDVTAVAAPERAVDLVPAIAAVVPRTEDRRLATAQPASRAKDRAAATPPPPAAAVAQAAPNVWLSPLKQWEVSSVFGMRWGVLHAGVDLATAHGTPIYAAHDGVVKLARWYGGYGNCVIIDHGNGVETLYGHSSKLLVTEGQRVRAGEEIALVGNTGHSFGPHLHYEVHIDGNAVDPVPWMRQVGVDFPNHYVAALSH